MFTPFRAALLSLLPFTLCLAAPSHELLTRSRFLDRVKQRLRQE